MPRLNNSNLLFQKGLITTNQFEEIKKQEELSIFSLHNEIRFFLFLSVLLFTTGSGILIYNHINSIGHLSILSLIFLTTLICFYYSFKHAKEFSKQKVVSEAPVYDYLILAATILTGIFIGYLQYQYSAFGTHYGLATLIPTLIYFFCAYYFDHKGVLSLAISGLCATVGFSTDPGIFLETGFSEDRYLSWSVITLGFIFILWTLYAEKISIKKHFNATYLNFALHLSSLVCIINLFSFYWMLYFLIIAGVLAFFIKTAYKQSSLNYFIFSLVYGYIAFNIIFFKLISGFQIYTLMIYISPFYLIASILLFRKYIKSFKVKTNHAGL